MDIQVCATLHDAFACSDKYLKKDDKIHTLDELLKNKVITQKEPSNTRAFLNKYMRTNGIDFKPDIEIGNEFDFYLINDKKDIQLEKAKEILNAKN